jgi:hypothetical protein
MKLHVPAALATALGCWASTSAAAAPITFEFSGTVTTVFDGGVLDSSVGVETPFVGFYTFHSDIPLRATEPGFATYRDQTPPAQFRVDVGNYRFQSDPNSPIVDIAVEDDRPVDRFAVGSLVNQAIGPSPIELLSDSVVIGWGLSDGSGPESPISSLELPSGIPILSAWSSNRLSIRALSGGPPEDIFTIEGTVTSIVPEPSSFPLLALAILALASARKW